VIDRDAQAPVRGVDWPVSEVVGPAVGADSLVELVG
jgi:hypothetical protein